MRISDSKKISAHYAKRTLIIDLIASLPYDIILASGIGVSALKVVRP